MNFVLKGALAEHPQHSYQIAKGIGAHPSRLSGFISGVAQPTPTEKFKLSAILGKPVSELFPLEVV